MAKDDFTLTIDEVSKRLNKSVRTIHRYKDAGRLSFRVGTSQGNPLFFSRSEVEGLAHELYPNMAPSQPPLDPQLWDRLERVERLLGMLERNPMMERLLSQGTRLDHGASSDLEVAIKRLADLEHEGPRVDRKELGEVLIRIGKSLSAT